MGTWTNLSPAASMAIGILVGLLSTCVQSLGLTLQRKSHMMDEKEEVEDRRPAYLRRGWQIGMFLFLIANIVGSTIQITTLPLPLLSTLQASGLVFNSILASLILKEAFTWRTAGGTILVAGGAILISLFSALPEPSHDLGQLLVLLRMQGFLIWFSLSLVFVVLVLAMDFVMRKVIPLRQRESPRLLLIRGMSYGAISGVLSAHALLLAKSAVELIVRSVADKHNQFSNYRSWLLVLAFVVLALSQLYYLHLGLRLISTSVLYPFVFCIYNIVAILDGLIYFRQMDRLSPLHSGLIALGTVVLLAGVLALSWRIQDESGDDGVQPVIKHEIPQTVLAPGMGFVGEPDSDDTTSVDPTDDEDENDNDDDVTEQPDADEQSFLLGTDSSRSHRLVPRGRSPYASRKRRRASTWKEVRDIWEDSGEHEQSYGTLADSPEEYTHATSSQTLTHNRNHHRATSGVSFDPDSQVTLEGNAGSSSRPRRARTLPNAGRSQSRSHRRTSQQHNSALFSDMLKLEWWRTRRKSDIKDGSTTTEHAVEEA